MLDPPPQALVDEEGGSRLLNMICLPNNAAEVTWRSPPELPLLGRSIYQPDLYFDPLDVDGAFHIKDEVFIWLELSTEAWAKKLLPLLLLLLIKNDLLSSKMT